MGQIANTELVVCSAETLRTHPELFHYTGLPAFESIVRSGAFWASHYRGFPDIDEVLLLKDRLPSAVAPQFDEIIDGVSLSRVQRRLWKKSGGSLGIAKDFVNSLYGATFLDRAAFGALDAFIVSFTTHAKDTDFERQHGVESQWRSYAGADGVCMVFDTAAMATHLGLEMDRRYWVRLALEPVRYDDAPISELFPELVSASADTLRQFLGGVRFPEMAVPEFLSGATLLKGAYYRPEREVRIVAIPGTQRLSDRAAAEHPRDFTVLPIPAARTRTDGRRYIPIFEPLGVRLPLKRVIVGPSARQAEIAAKVAELVGDAPITLSKCFAPLAEPV